MSLRTRFSAGLAALALLALAGTTFAGDAGRWRKLELPGSRWFHAAAYDAGSQRIVYFGGEAPGGYLSDLWELSLVPAPHWQRLEASNTGPGERYGFSFAYDTARDRLLLFGGQLAPGYTSEVWALSLSNPPAWSLVAAAGGPSGRHQAALIYDPVRDRLVVHGGRNGSGYLADMWALSLGGTPTWTALTPSGSAPVARAGHAAAYDPVRDRLVCFGGRNASGSLGDFFALSLAGSPAWSTLPTSGSPPAPSAYASATYDPVDDRLVVFGGSNATALTDAHAFDFGTSSWSDLTPFGAPFAGRIGHTATYDPVHHALVVFAGGDLGALQWYRDAWSLSLDAAPVWTALPSLGDAPPARTGHSAIADPVRGRMIVFGGQVDFTYANDLWELPLEGEPVWSRIWTQGPSPSPRFGHTALYDEANDRMIVYGGRDESGPLDDVWALPLAGFPMWEQLSPAGTGPAARYEHGAAYDPVRQRMVVTGGRNAGSYFGDAWELSLDATPTWRDLAPGAPECLTPHAFHTLVNDRARDQFVDYGGDNYGMPACRQVWALHDVGQSWWSEIPATGPAWRYEHTAVIDPSWDRMVVFGGRYTSYGPGDPSRQFGDLWELLPGTPQWNPLSPAPYLPSTPAPDSLSGHTAVYDAAHHRMILFGGQRGLSFADLVSECWSLEWLAGPVGVTPGPAARTTLALTAGPSPLRGEGRVRLTLPAAGHVSVSVFDVAGRQVARLADETRAAGSHEWRWRGEGRPGGLYFVRARTSSGTATARFVLAR
ncbi:MAG: kelch repeat-containing protein [Candidatus Eisenbacteria bacterium]